MAQAGAGSFHIVTVLARGLSRSIYSTRETCRESAGEPLAKVEILNKAVLKACICERGVGLPLYQIL